MTGFLGRMVARARTPERALRPRVHSLYESAPQTAFEEVTWDAPAVREVRTESAPAVRERAIAQTALPPPSDGVLPAPRRPQPRDPVEAPRSVTASTHTEARAGVEERQPREPQAPGDAAAQRADAAAPTPPPAILEREVLLPPEVRTIVRTRRGADRIERLRLRSERTTIQRELVSEGPIEITIGRIDVRAVTDTAREAPRTTREAAPTMSLRDYLAQRDARRRR